MLIAQDDHLFFGQLQLLIEAGRFPFGFGQLLPVFRFPGQLLLASTDFGFYYCRFSGFLVSLFFGPVAVYLVDIQPQNVAQNFLALGRTFGCEFIGPSLKQKCRIDKGIIIEMQDVR